MMYQHVPTTIWINSQKLPLLYCSTTSEVEKPIAQNWPLLMSATASGVRETAKDLPHFACRFLFDQIITLNDTGQKGPETLSKGHRSGLQSSLTSRCYLSLETPS